MMPACFRSETESSEANVADDPGVLPKSLPAMMPACFRSETGSPGANVADNPGALPNLPADA